MARMRHGDALGPTWRDPGGRASPERVTIDMVDGRTGTALICPDDAMDDTIFVHDLRLNDGTEMQSGWMARGLSRHRGHFVIFHAAQ